MLSIARPDPAFGSLDPSFAFLDTQHRVQHVNHARHRNYMAVQHNEGQLWRKHDLEIRKSGTYLTLRQLQLQL